MRNAMSGKKSLGQLFLLVMIVIALSTNSIQVEAWSGTNHIKVMKETSHYSKFTSSETKLLEACVLRCDSHYTTGNLGIGNYLHGGGNYVLNLRFLYTVAYYFNIGESNAINKALAEMANDVSNVNAAVTNVLNTQIISGVNESSNRSKAIKVLGLALHLGGDIYSHCAVIPSNSISMFNSSHFKNSSEFTRFSKDIAKGTLKFVKIGEYGPAGSQYEDNINFFPTRFTKATTYTTERLLYYFTNKKEWGLSIVLPWTQSGGWKDKSNGVTVTMKMKNIRAHVQNSGYGSNYVKNKFNLDMSEISADG